MDWTGQGYECNQYGEEEEDYEEEGKYKVQSISLIVRECHLGPKKSRFQGPHLPMTLVMDIARIKTITYWYRAM